MKHVFRYRAYALILITIVIGGFVYCVIDTDDADQNEETISIATSTGTEIITEDDEMNEASSASTSKPIEIEPKTIPTPESKGESVDVTMPPMKSERTETTMAWIYPGEPACDALAEAKERDIDILKPEYFLVTTGGKLEKMTEELYGCNGYSKANVATVRATSEEQYVMVSSSYAEDMRLFLEKDVSAGTHIATLVEFVEKEEFEGVELDFEDYGGWTPEVYGLYKQFLQRLGEKLHAKGKKLMVDVPAVSNEIEENWYVLRLADMALLPVDYLVVMAYDYQYDHGVGEPIAPLDWITEVANFTLSRYPERTKIVMGIPAYGYKGRGATNIQIMTRDQLATMPGYSTAERDTASGEMTWRTGKSTFVYQDEVSLRMKREVILEAGISSVSVWHLGGNSWFK